MANSAIVGVLKALLTADTAQFDAAMKRASGGLKAFTADTKSIGRQAEKIGGSLTALLTVPIVGIGTAAVAAGAEFERTMNQVGAITNASADDMRNLSAAASEWGAKTKFSNTEAAQAMLELGKAGFSAKQTIEALPSVLQLATAANMRLGEAAALTANVMNTFGLEAEQLAHSNDVLTEAANRSTIDVADLRESLKFVGPVARIAGISLADVAAASAQLGQNGIKAEMAGTALRGMFSELLSPSKSLKALLVDLGFQQEVAAGKTVSWTEMLDRLKAKFGEGKDSADQFAGMIMEGFGKRAGPAVIALAQTGGQAISDLSASLDASEGSAKRMSDAFMKGLPGAMETAKGAIETMLASIETALGPTLEKILNGVASLAGFVANDLMPAFNALPEPVKTAGVVLAGLAAAAGPVIWAFGQVASSVAVLLPYLPALGTAFTTLLGVLTGPVGLAVVAVVALGAAWMKWGDDITRVVKEAYTAVKTWLWDKLEPVLTPIGELLTSVGKMFEAFGLLVGAVGELVLGHVKKIATDVKLWLLDKLKPVIDPVKAMYDSLATKVGQVKDTVIGIARALYEGVKKWLLDQFTGMVTSVKGQVDKVTGFFKDLYDKVVGHSYVPDLIARIKANFDQLDKVMVKPARESVGEAIAEFARLPGQIGQYIDDAIAIIRAPDRVAALKSYASAFARDFIAGFADFFIPGLGLVIQMAWPVIEEGIKAIGNAIKSFFKGLWNGIKDFFGGGESEVREDEYEAMREREREQNPYYGGTTPPPDYEVNDPRGDPAYDEYWRNLSPYYMGDGGIVRSPTLAVIGEEGPEAVVPLNGQALGKIHVNVNIDRRTMARAVVPAIPGAMYELGLA